MFTLDALNPITTVNGLTHCVLESLFSNAIAHDWEAKRQGNGDRQGWWAADVRAEHGSKLWLLEREKTTQDTEDKLIAYINKSLAWVNDNGSFEIKTQRLIDRINFSVTVTYNDLTIEVNNE